MYIHSHVARFFVLHLFMYVKILLVIQVYFFGALIKKLTGIIL